MITKITSRLTPIVKQPVRANLQKASVVGLASLAGGGMSGANEPHFTPTDMVIPGGLDMREKAYYLLKGKLPESVYSRWAELKSDYIPCKDDQIVTVNIGAGRYVDSIVEGPREIGSMADSLEPLNGNIKEILTPNTPFIDGDLDGDGELSSGELLTRFLGQY